LITMKKLITIMLVIIGLAPSLAMSEATKLIMGSEPQKGDKPIYSAQEWAAQQDNFATLRGSLALGTRGAVVAVTQFLCDLDYRIPYANYAYQQEYDQAYAVYPNVGLNTQWGERYKLSNGKTLPPQGLYCSALVEWVYINAGIACDSRITTDVRPYKGVALSTKEAFAEGRIRPGDTVHTSQKPSKSGRRYNHVGIVIEVGEDYLLVAEMRPMKGLVKTRVSGRFGRFDTVVVDSELYRDKQVG